MEEKIDLENSFKSKLENDITHNKTAIRGLIGFGFGLLIVFVIISIISIIIGKVEFPDMKEISKTSFESSILSYQKGFILTIESLNSKRSVILRKENNDFIILPIDLETLLEISFSPDAKKIIYLSSRQQNTMGIINIDYPKIIGSNSHLLMNLIRNDIFQILLKDKTICSWSPIAWSDDSKRIAFYICDNSSSYLTVAKVDSGIDIVWCGEENFSLKKRNIEWTNSTQLFYTSTDPQPFINKIDIQKKIDQLKEQNP